ncbi:glycosyltransferase family 2 protein [Comamonadaceae bacterium BS-T2-15]|uniref:Glycosyltransferase family 2 protein n=1 Tax=Scleromatobacter humisilvae TaxID=2897159 RepID=A0A9X1YGY1_9BURK|nr:glycosyltransferase family 2 protein [Scleromatobacter humisilvae]
MDKALAPIGGGDVIVVDNASRDGSAEFLRQDRPHVTLIESGANLGFGRANNLALDRIKSRYLLLLNTDAFVPPDALVGPLEYMEAHPECGVLGVRLVGRDGEPQPGCRYFPTPLNSFWARAGFTRRFGFPRMVDDVKWDHRDTRECDWVPGCYYLTRREVLERVGLFDPRFFLYYEEVDHCREVKNAGWRVVFWPHVDVVHLGGESAKSEGVINKSRQLDDLQLESGFLYYRKHHGLAGALAFLALEELADVIVLLKIAFMAKGWQRAREVMDHMRAMFRTASITGFGRAGTR